MTQPTVAHAPAKPAANNKSRLIILQVVLTLGAFGYLFYTSDIDKLRRAFNEAPWWSVPAGVGVLLCVMFAGTVRWHLLMASYGARTIPPLAYLFRLQLIGLFYNMMPGAIGGDVLRGVVSRHAFGAQGMGAGLTVVLVERLFGVLALMLLVVSTLALHPVRGLQLSPWVFALGLLGSVGCLLGIALGRRIAAHLPGFLARPASALPELTRPVAFVLALGMSVVNQTLVGVMGHTAVGPLSAGVGILDSLVLSPLAFAAIFVPVTVAGAGTRDAAMVALYGLLGVPKDSVLLASLEILVAYIVVAAIGGGLSLITPLRDAKPATVAPNPG